MAKLDAYGFSRASLKLMQNYLRNRQQRICINGSFSDWTKVITGAPQGFILGPLLFNMFLNDIFMFISNAIFVIMSMTTLIVFYWKRSKPDKKKP